MAVPKKKTSQSRKRMRRAHDFIGKTNHMECSNCGSEKLPHHVCKSCGYYDGKQVLADGNKAA